MNDFGSQLSSMLDDVAASIHPTPNFEAVRSASVPVVANPAAFGERFRAPLGVAAAAVLLFAGVGLVRVLDSSPSSTSADANVPLFLELDGDRTPWREPSGDRAVPATTVPTTDDATAADAAPPTTTDEVTTTKVSAELGATVLDGDRVLQHLSGSAPDGTVVTARSDAGPPAVGIASDGVWSLAIDLTGAERGVPVRVVVTVGDGSADFEFDVIVPAQKEEPEPEPKEAPSEEPAEEPAPKPEEEPKPAPEPAPKEESKPEPQPEPAPSVPFASQLGEPYQDGYYMKQTFFGTAPAGSKIVAASAWGSVDTTADAKGRWEMRLILTEVPDGTVVVVEVSASSGGSARYELVRIAPAPVQRAFTSNLGDVYDNVEYFKPVLSGTGNAGSIVEASSTYGSASVEVGHDGYWELWFKMFDVPNGPVDVRVVNSQSEAVFEYTVHRAAAWEEPEVIGFTANALYVECDSTPPYNDYWGTAQPGAKVTVSSPFGGGHTTADESGNWELRVEFPEAPLGETFFVLLTNSKSEVAFEKPFKRVEPA